MSLLKKAYTNNYFKSNLNYAPDLLGSVCLNDDNSANSKCTLIYKYACPSCFSKQEGEYCDVDQECITNFCQQNPPDAPMPVCEQCGGDNICHDNNTCDLESGKCLLKTGEPCESDEQCITNFCPSSNPVCSICSYTEKCTDDKICDPETKKCLLRTGEPCHSDEQCVTNFCPSSNSVCSTCGPSMKCNGDKICDPNVISGNKKCGTLENLCKSNFVGYGNCMHEDNEEDSKDLCSLCNKAYPSTYKFAYRPDGSKLFYCWNDCLK